MIPYYCCFFISTFLIYLANRNKQGKSVRTALLLFAILIPCILSGLRDPSIGTDTDGYPLYYFNLAGIYDIQKYVEISTGRIEVLYVIFIYLVRKATDQFLWVLLLTQFVIDGFIYASIKENVEARYRWIGMLVYYMLFYNISYNLMRQFIAIAIMFWAFKYLKQQKYIAYFIIVVVASQIHLAAVTGVLVIPLYVFLAEPSEKKKKLLATFKKYRRLIILIILLATVFVVAFSRNIIVAFSVLKASYNYQVNKIQESFGFRIYEFLVMFAVVLPGFVFYKSLKKQCKLCLFYITTVVVGLILWQLRGYSIEMYRQCFSFWIFTVHTIPSLISAIAKQNKNNARITMTYLIGSLGLYSWYMFINYNLGLTFPYMSTILGIH